MINTEFYYYQSADRVLILLLPVEICLYSPNFICGVLKRRRKQKQKLMSDFEE